MLEQHGLIEDSWTFGFDRAKTRYGCTDFNKKRITLSQYFVHSENTTLYDIENTIAHEMAHAIVGYAAGHNKEWREKAIELGSDGKRCSDKAAVGIPGEFRVVCPCGVNNVLRYRWSKRLSRGVCKYCLGHLQKVPIVRVP